MRIRHVPDTFEKLQVLGGMATDDVLSRPEPTSRTSTPYTSARRNSAPGVYKASMPNGKKISLMRVMFTDFCKYDCHYCPNSNWVPRKRYAFKVDELANAFAEMRRRHTVSGLFLSSGIAGSSSKTTERMLKVIEVIRKKQGFQGYVHMKVMPGTERQFVEEAHRLGTRLSVNIETPTGEMLSRISPMKDMQRDILEPMGWVDDLNRRNGPGKGVVGQATQMVVGAANESDWDIFRRIDQLYGDWQFKRIQESVLLAVPANTAHAARRTSRHAHDPGAQAVPGRLAETSLPILQRRTEAGVRPERVSASRRRSEDVDRPEEPRRLSDRRERGKRGAATACAWGWADFGEADTEQPSEALDRHLARPAGNGSGAQAGVAFSEVPWPPTAYGKAAPAGPVRRSRKGEAPADGGRRTEHGRTVWSGHVLCRLPALRYAGASWELETVRGACPFRHARAPCPFIRLRGRFRM